MIKLIRIIFILFFLSSQLLAVPDRTMTISPSATSGGTITAADENSRNNTVATQFNNHDHTDISQTANTLNIGDGTAGNKTINANTNAATKSSIRWDNTAARWTLSGTDGTYNSILQTSSTTGNFTIDLRNSVQGDILIRNASEWVRFAAGTSGQTLHTNGTGSNPSWAAINLASSAQITGNLPVANLNSGTGASSTTFWRGDATWVATPRTARSTVSITAGASGTQSVTGLSFQPIFVIALCSRSTIVQGASVGFGAGADETVLVTTQTDATKSEIVATAIFRMENTAISAYQQGINITIDSGGITWSNDSAGGGFALTVDFLFVG